MQFLLQLAEILPHWTLSEGETYRNLAAHLEAHGGGDRFAKALEYARLAMRKASIRNRPAWFIWKCGQRFGFRRTVQWVSPTARRRVEAVQDERRQERA